jgi:hypothetical protein
MLFITSCDVYAVRILAVTVVMICAFACREGHNNISITFLSSHRAPTTVSLQGNKCQEVMGYCGFLVHIGLFEAVELHFLLVGHTHSDVDASFGT